MAPGPLPRCGSGSCRQKLVRAFKRAAARTRDERDRKSTRLNSSHLVISYAVFCLKKKKKKNSILQCCEGYTDVRLRRCPKSTASHMSSNRLKARRYARSGDGAPLPARQAAGRQAR